MQTTAIPLNLLGHIQAAIIAAALSGVRPSLFVISTLKSWQSKTEKFQSGKLNVSKL
jgi:hypothetical protein